MKEFVNGPRAQKITVLLCLQGKIHYDLVIQVFSPLTGKNSHVKGIGQLNFGTKQPTQ